MYNNVVRSLRKIIKAHKEIYGGSTEESSAIEKAADAIEELSKLADAIPHVCECCVGCELEKKNGGCDHAFVLSPKRAMQYLIKPRWIPVTERLPECEWSSEVGNIEWINCGMVFAGCFGRGGKYRNTYFRTWTDGTEGIDAKDADYWRPIQIPEPPKEEA